MSAGAVVIYVVIVLAIVVVSFTSLSKLSFTYINSNKPLFPLSTHGLHVYMFWHFVVQLFPYYIPDWLTIVTVVIL